MTRNDACRATDSEETQDWVRRQNVCTEAVLAQCELQPLILRRFEEVYNYEKLSVPSKHGEVQCCVQ